MSNNGLIFLKTSMMSQILGTHTLMMKARSDANFFNKLVEIILL
jgi:hypothetical protein